MAEIGKTRLQALSLQGSFMTSFSQVKKIVESAASFGRRETAFGAILYGQVPHIAPEAWLHVLYKGLSAQEISSLEAKVGRPLPSLVQKFLTHTNGANFFSNSLVIYGDRKTYDRIGDAAWQPFAMETPNVSERPPGIKESYIFIGSYFDDGSKLVVDSESSKIYRLPQRKAGPVLTEWPDFWSMLLSEVQRLSLLFDDTGRLRDESSPTTPPSNK